MIKLVVGVEMIQKHLQETRKNLNKYMGMASEINTLRPRQDGRHFPDDIFNCIFLNGKVWILIKISLKFVPKDPINNIPSLAQIYGLASARRQAIIWTNDGEFIDAYMCYSASMS